MTFSHFRSSTRITISLAWHIAAMSATAFAPPSHPTIRMPEMHAVLKSELKRPSKTLTVGVEFDPPSDDAVSNDDITLLSMQLRNAKVSTIVCSDPAHVQCFVQEQETARGSFPGPCPVIYGGALDGIASAVEAGACGVIVDADDAAGVADMELGEVDVIWRVQSMEELESVVELTKDVDEADKLLLFDGPTAEELAEASSPLPRSGLMMAAVPSMQADGAEVEVGRGYKSSGCASILVKGACVSDAEDVDYAKFVVDGLTSKASSEFTFSGLTGSTNGHFGGVQSNGSVKWRRTEQ